MRLDWTSLLAACSSTAVTGAVAALYGPKAGTVAGALAFVVQSQLHPVVRSSADPCAAHSPSDGQRVQAVLVPPPEP